MGDEVTKALREIEEMERSIKKDEDDKQKRKSSKKSRKVDSSVEKTQLDIEKTENLPGSSDKLKKTKPSKDKKEKNEEHEKNVSQERKLGRPVLEKELKEVKSQSQNEKHSMVVKDKLDLQVQSSISHTPVDTEDLSSVETISAAQSHSEEQILLMEDKGTAVENSTGLSVCSLVDREQTSQTVLPKDDKQTEKPKVIEKAEENMNILTEDWVKVQNLVSFSKKFLQLSDTDSEISCDNEMKCVSDNINALQTAIIQGDAVYAQKIIVTIIEKITIMIEIIEYRIIRIRKTTNNVHREQLYKDIESEVKFINEHITVLHNCTTTSGIMNEQLATIVTDCVNKIE